MPLSDVLRSRKQKGKPKPTYKPVAGFPLGERVMVRMVKGGEVAIGDASMGRWQLVVVYRGYHSPVCRAYLAKLQALHDAFTALECDVVAVSGDPLVYAQKMIEEGNLATLPIAYGMSLEQMMALGLYVSDPIDVETDREHAEPAVLLFNPQRELQVISISNASFARPDLDVLLAGLEYCQKNKEHVSVGGTYAPTA